MVVVTRDDAEPIPPSGADAASDVDATHRAGVRYRDDAPSDAVTYGLEPHQRGLTWFKVLFPIGLVLFVTFWVWALFFASKTSVNKIDDEAWAERAEVICAPVKQSVRELDLLKTDDIQARADLVELSTDMLSDMLDEVVAVDPTDEKGRAIVPDWEAEYRQLLQDRYDYAAKLRSGVDGPFTETPVNGVPVTERLETFAADNGMSSCAPPRAGVL